MGKFIKYQRKKYPVRRGNTSSYWKWVGQHGEKEEAFANPDIMHEQEKNSESDLAGMTRELMNKYANQILSSQQYKIYTMFFIEGKKDVEIAKKIGVSPQYIHNQKDIIGGKFKRLIEAEQNDNK